MQRSWPDCSAGFSRLDASIAPPLVAPAPITVWISSMNRIAFGVVLQLLHHALQALFEVAAIARAGQQRAHVEREDRRVGQNFRHLLFIDLARQAFGDRRLANARIADQQRIVLLAAAEDLDRAQHFRLAPDQRIDLAFLGLLVEVHAVGGERFAALLHHALAVFAFLARRAPGAAAPRLRASACRAR